jgi:hypothetical protein
MWIWWKQHSYMPSWMSNNILTKKYSLLFEPPSYYCIICASKIFTLSLVFSYKRPRQKGDNIKMGPKEKWCKSMNWTEIAQQGSNWSFCTHNNECQVPQQQVTDWRWLLLATRTFRSVFSTMIFSVEMNRSTSVLGCVSPSGAWIDKTTT